ncbi:beta-galactosidase trimerization domain-containing protein [bacterium]|nr:beta-galactosidase trimerization domain-containing protein [bacterium]
MEFLKWYRRDMLLYGGFFLLLFCAGTPAPAQTDPFIVDRPGAVYETVLTDRRIDRKVTSFYYGLYGRTKGYTDETWASEQHHFLLESAAAGIDGPFALEAIASLGEPVVNEFNEKYGMKFPIMAPLTAYSNAAKKAGATFVFSEVYQSWEHGLVACWDPRFIEAARAGTEEWLKKYGDKPWLSCVLGQDEPFNWAGTARAPGAVDQVNRELREKYGITIALTAEDTTLARPWEMTDPAVLNRSPHDVALMRIAVWRWLNGQLYKAAKPQYDLVHRYAPGIEYHAYNRNAINIMDFINKDVPNSIDRIDQSAIYEVTDSFSADPYPTRNFTQDGRERALYHVGFVAKLITDLAAGKPSKIIMEGFLENGLPTPDGLRELTSQAAKAGVTHLEWFGASRFPHREYYREILRLSRLWKDLPALDIPKKAEIAVLFSDDSRNAVNDDLLNGHYMLHALLGEKLGAWYSFVSENHVRRGLQSLDDARLIIAPQLSYVSREFAEKLISRVEQGATLVILDPDALISDIETGSLASFRKRLMGAPLGKNREASHMLPATEGSQRFKGIDRLILQPGKKGVTARTLNIPAGAEVLFTYEDGTPAVYSRSLGRGEVIVFSAMPFGDSRLALRQTGWNTFFTVLCDELGIKRDLPIWRFTFPKTGGEVAMYKLLVTPGE